VRPSIRRLVSPSLRRGSTAIYVGIALTVLILVATYLLPRPYQPSAVNPYSILTAPSADHLFGTDSNGADVFSRVLAGGRLDITLTLIGTLISAVIGVPLGLLASARSRVARVIVGALDVFQSFPLLLLAVVVVALMGNNIDNVVVALILVLTPQFIRLVRSDALVVRESRFVEAAEAVGASRSRVTFRHILPNVSGTVLTQFSLALSNGLLTVAALSFIGVGVSPAAASWGSMVRNGSQVIATGNWWVALFPGLAIVAFVFSVNLLADGVDTRLSVASR